MTYPTAVPAAWRELATDLVHQHAWVLDRGDPRDLPDLYEPDGQLIGLAEPLIGQAALADWATKRAALPRISRHVQANHRMWVDQEGRFRGSLVTMMFRYDAPAGEALPVGPVGPAWPMVVVDYDDEYAVHEDRCRFRSRHVTRVFVDDGRFKP